MILFTLLFTLLCAFVSYVGHRFSRYHEDQMSGVAATICGAALGLLISITITLVTN